MKVKAAADAKLQRQIEEYAAWYAQWDIDTLMRGRMRHKAARISSVVPEQGAGAKESKKERKSKKSGLAKL